MQKLLTIAVPSYNVEKTLAACLNSMISDRLREVLEVIIVDDGSTDSTAELAKSYVMAEPDIFRLVSQRNGGHGAAVATGIRNARGKFFRIVDGDDWVDSEGLEKLTDKMRADGIDAFIDTKTEHSMLNGKTAVFPIPGDVDLDEICLFEDVCLRGDIISYVMIHTLSVRTSLLQESLLTLPRHVFYEDYLYVAKAVNRCTAVCFTGLTVYQYRVGSMGQSISADSYVRRYKDHDRVLRELLRFQEKTVTTQNKKEYLARMAVLLINTQYNIALIYDKDRKRGVQRGRRLRKNLKEHAPAFASRTARRYLECTVLHLLGVDYPRLNRLLRRNLYVD